MGQFEFEECPSFFGCVCVCVCVHHFVQYFPWKKSSKMQEFTHSVLILATLLLCSEGSLNHSIGIIGSLSVKKKTMEFSWIFPNLKLQIFLYKNLSPPAIGRPFFRSPRKEMGFFVGGELPALGRPITINEAADHIFGSSVNQGKKDVRLDKSLRNEKVQRFVLNNYPVHLFSLFWIWIEWW